MFSEVSSASGTEEEESGEVRYGRHDRDVAHLYRLVSSALHVSGQIGGWSRQQTLGRVRHHHTGGLSGKYPLKSHYSEVFMVVLLIFIVLVAS